MSGVVAALLCAMSWAIGFVTMRNLSSKLDPFTLNAPRTLVGAISMVIAMYATGHQVYLADITWTKYAYMAAALIVGAGIGDSLYIVSMARIGISKSFPISSTYPAITLLLGVLFFDQSLSVTLVIGLVLTIAGVLLISRHKPGENSETSADTAGISLALVAAALWAISALILKPGIEGLDSVAATAVRLPVIVVFFFGMSIAKGKLHTLWQLNLKEWFLIVFGGLIGWGAGSILFVQAVATLGPARAAIITSTSPLFALPMSIILLHEKPCYTVWIGTILTVVGIALVS